jgi:hypothetical protein
LGDEEINGGKKDSEGTSSEEMVQGKVERCAVWKALWTTTGRKARHALLQTLKTCKQKNTCDCWGDVKFGKTFSYSTKETNRSTCRETEES